MKLYLMLLLGFIIFILSYSAGLSTNKENSMKVYKFAAEWGCYQGAERACGFLQKDEEAQQCVDDALRECPRSGESFVAFLRQPLKK